jgi:Na+-translocating ferredoxin:NAD+ oxidoreductase subunit G
MAKKLESTLLNMVLSLTSISLVMSAALSIVYLKTKSPIEEAAKTKENEAIEQVLPSFNSEPASSAINVQGTTIYEAKLGDSLVGYAVKTYTDIGFGGHIEIIAGFKPDGSIFNSFVLQHKETPGLGTKMTESKFRDQFKGKNPADFLLKVKKDGGQVDAITAATISSRAYCDALQRAYNALITVDTASIKK